MIKKKRKRRGTIAGLVPLQFLADMFGWGLSTTKKRFYNHLQGLGKARARDLTPREFAVLVHEWVSNNNEKLWDTCIDDHIEFMQLSEGFEAFGELQRLTDSNGEE